MRQEGGGVRGSEGREARVTQTIHTSEKGPNPLIVLKVIL